MKQRHEEYSVIMKDQAFEPMLVLNSDMLKLEQKMDMPMMDFLQNQDDQQIQNLKTENNT